MVIEVIQYKVQNPETEKQQMISPLLEFMYDRKE